ncbi:amidohydrolase [Rhodococcoides fascians]|uniref:amidohydrolase n=1 Tax=Rhodococcoides fascians TaxID=1828 RepID=UPI00056A3476|nr:MULTISPECIES: amidohydrolase [Rhodococcus]OZF00505.1 amidohydrolase [Rhodococcus sp. 15-1189-1-1a]OZF14385.1 amidohydrolase [Rhodococcus sp. 14-2686-1-2]
MATADSVYLNGKVFTVDPDFTVVTAVAIADGKILTVGSDADVSEAIGPDTVVVDLAGKTVLPGINDSHLHAFAFGLDTPPLSIDLNFPMVRSIADVVSAVADAVSDAEKGDWIVGTGWDEGYLDECVADPSIRPTRFDLDAVSPENPVFLQDYSRHVSWVNSLALELAGVDENTVVPEGGVMPKNADGQLIGIVQEGAQSLVQAVLPKLTRERRTEAVKSAISILQREGITSFTDPALGPGGEDLAGGAMGEEGLSVYAELAATGDLGIRVSALMLPTGMSGSSDEFERNLAKIVPPETPDTQVFQIIGVKVFADGIPPSKTAWMHEEYIGGGCGSLCVGGDTDERRVAEVTEMIRIGHEAGHQIGVHVTGDRAIDTVADALIAAQTAHPRPDARHYLIHGDFISSETLARLATHGIGVNMNPTIKWTIADLEVGVVGEERAAYEWPYRSAVESGVVLMSSSDAPVTSPDWRQGISTMILRETKASGAVSGPDQTIGLADAVRTYTINPAWQDFAEDWKGSLEPGKVADLCVLDGDLETIDPHDIPSMPVLYTVLGGAVVFERETSAVQP